MKNILLKITNWFKRIYYKYKFWLSSNKRNKIISLIILGLLVTIIVYFILLGTIKEVKRQKEIEENTTKIIEKVSVNDVEALYKSLNDGCSDGLIWDFKDKNKILSSDIDETIKSKMTISYLNIYGKLDKRLTKSTYYDTYYALFNSKPTKYVIDYNAKKYNIGKSETEISDSKP